MGAYWSLLRGRNVSVFPLVHAETSVPVSISPGFVYTLGGA